MSSTISSTVKIAIGTINYGDVQLEGVDVNDYVAIGFSTSFDTLYEYDKVYLEKIVADLGSTAATNLFNGSQPDYYMDTDLYMSENNFMESGDGAYLMYFIDVTENVRYGSRVLYDFDIADIETKVYGYRIRYYQSSNGIDVTEYTTDYNVICRSISVESLLDKYVPSFRPCLTPRNLAFRGRNSSLKQNMMLREIEADVRQLNGCMDTIDDSMELITISEYSDPIPEDAPIDPETFEVLYEVKDYVPIMATLNDFYDVETQILLKLKYR